MTKINCIAKDCKHFKDGTCGKEEIETEWSMEHAEACYCVVTCSSYE